jgi:hypothetical protein
MAMEQIHNLAILHGGTQGKASVTGRVRVPATALEIVIYLVETAFPVFQDLLEDTLGRNEYPVATIIR